MKIHQNKNYDDFYDFEEITVKLIKRFIDNNKKKLNLNFRDLDLTSVCEKYLYYKINSSENFYNFFLDLKHKKIKKNYIFECYEIKIIAEDLCKLYKKKNINLFYKKNFFKNIVFLFFYLFIIFFSFTFSFKNKKNKSLVCILNHKKFMKEYNYILNNTKFKKIFLNYKNLLPLNLFIFLKLNFKNYFKNISRQRTFIFMHKLYLRTYIFETNIEVNNPFLILFYEGDSVDHEIASQIGKKRKVRTVCIQWGGVIYNKPKSSFRKSTFSNLLVWGKNYEIMFKKYNPKVKISIIGAPHLRNIKNNSKKILFLIPQKSPQFEKLELIKYVRFIKKLSEKLPNKILIRTHPQDNFGKNLLNEEIITNVDIDDARTVSLHNSLSRSILMITIGSSSIFEAGINGVVPILYAKSDRKIWNQNICDLKNKYGLSLFENKNIENVEKTIFFILKNKKILNKISKKIKYDFKKEIKYKDNESIKRLRNFIKNNYN